MFDANRRVAYVSKIFDWFEEDFLAEAGSLQAYMARYVTDQASARVLRADGFDVNYRDYDWGLNGRYSL